MARKSSILLPVLIIPVVGIVVALALFSYLSVQLTEQDQLAVQTPSEQTDSRDRIAGAQTVVRTGSTSSSGGSTGTSSDSKTARLSSSEDAAGARPAAAEIDSNERNTSLYNQQLPADGEAIVVTGESDAARVEAEDIATDNRRNADEPETQDAELESDVDGGDEDDEQDIAEEDSEPVENSGSEQLAGRVVDSGGFPVTGLSVSVTNRDNETNYASTVVTGRGGRFELRDILPGEYLLKTVATDDYPSVSLYVRSGNTAATLTVSRLNRITVVGIVRSESGQFLSDVKVQTPDGTSSAASDAEGKYRIELVSSQNQGFVVNFLKERHIEEFLHITSSAIKATPPGEPVRGDVVLRRTGRLSISGEVLDPHYVPIKDALVQVTSRQRDFHESIQSDENGRFQIEGMLEASDYTIKASSTSEYGIWLRQNVELTQPVEYSITLDESSSGRMAGSIVDRNQIPLPKLSLLAMRGGSDGRVVSIQSDDNGYFEINDFVASELSFVSKSAPSIKIEGASIAAGDDIQATLVVNIGRNELTGTLISEESQQPISGARLTLTWQESFGNLRSRVSHSTESDSEGVFRFSELGDGEWTLGISADGRKTVSQKIKPATQTGGLVVPMQRG